MKCHICNKIVDKNNGKHIYYCDTRDISREEKKIIYLKYNNYNLDYEYLQEHYIKKEKSIVEISKENNIPYHYVVNFLDLYNITKRNIKEATGTKRNIEQRENTSLKRYGVTNPAKSPIIKEKVKDTFLKNYGVSNIFKDENFKNELPNIMIKKYGVGSLSNRYGKMNEWWASITPEEKKRRIQLLNDGYKQYWNSKSIEEKYLIIEKRLKNGSSIGRGKSKLEDRLSNILFMENISHIRQKWIKCVSFDFLIEHTNIIIEVNGDFYHANPTLYKADDILNVFGEIKTANDIWLKDLTKKSIAETYGYVVYYIWESDMNKISDNELYLIIKDIIVQHYENKINKTN